MELKIKELGIMNHGVLSEDGTKIHIWGMKNSKVFEQKGDLLNFKANIDPMAMLSRAEPSQAEPS